PGLSGEDRHQSPPRARITLVGLGQPLGDVGVHSLPTRRGSHAASPSVEIGMVIPLRARWPPASDSTAKAAAATRTIVPPGARSHSRAAVRPTTTDTIPMAAPHRSVPAKERATIWADATGSTM